MPRKAYIRSIGMSVAKRVMKNAEFEQLVETSDEWIKSRTGISERRVAGENESASTFAINAAKEAMQTANVSPDEIDLVLVATVTGDYPFPSTACIVQDAIGAKNASAFDIGAACAGFIYGCEVVGSMIESGKIKRALLIGVDVLTKTMDWKDRSTCILFGDGGGAALLEAGDGPRGLIATSLKADGSGGKYIKIESGGSVHPFQMQQQHGCSPYLYMEGKEVYRFAVKAMGDSCMSALEKANMKVEDVDLFVPHQANERIITAASDRIGLPHEKVFMNVQKYGNMSAGSIPVALYEAQAQGRLKQGDVVMTVGFGAGLVWGANLIRW